MGTNIQPLPTSRLSTTEPDYPVLIREIAAAGFVRVSRNFTEQMGYEATELKEKPLLDWIEPERQDCFRKLLEKGSGSITAGHLNQQGTWIEYDWQIKTKDGIPVVFGILHEGGRALSNPSADPPSQVPATMHEILEETARIIEDERPGMKCSVLLLSEDGSRIEGGAGPSLPEEYNRAVEGLLIGPSVGSCGTAAFWNQRVIVEDIQNDALWRDLKELAAKAGVASCWSHPITSKSGRVLGATALYSPTPRTPTPWELNGLGTAARMFGLAIDHAYAEQALEKAKAARARRESELEDQLHRAAKLEALGVLAGGTAHDFNNLLVTVLNNAELAMKTVPQDGETHQMLRDIITASRGATELCNQMLAYAGRGAISKQRLDCNTLVSELGGLLQVAISKKAKLQYELSPEPPLVEADKAQLLQVFMNLITNASEALGSEPGKIIARTGIEDYSEDHLAEFQIGGALCPGSYVTFSVTDTGSGMSHETMDKIFDPFFTTKFTGRGLGMAAVRGIILRHKGYIRIESELGKGTTFTVLLPCATATSSEPSTVKTSPTEKSSKQVMIVDDEPQVRKTLGRVLRFAGFDVVQAADGQEAIRRYEADNASIDCVLLDLSMPDLDGEETFRELKKIRPEVKVVLNSGYAEEEILNRIEGAGFAGLLHKPTSNETLIATLQDVMDS